MFRFLVALLLAASALNAHAETFTVTRSDDPQPDGCQPGDCSLREAMEAAQANDPFGETDTIVLPNGTYTLIRGRFNDITQAVRVQGAGAGQTRIETGAVDDALFWARFSGKLWLTGVSLDVAGDFASAIVASDNTSMELEDVLVERGSVTFNNSGVGEIRHSELRRSLYSERTLLVEDSTLFNLYQMTPQTGTPDTTLRRVLIDGTLYPDPPLPSTITVHSGPLTIEDSILSDTTLRGGPDARVSGSTITRTPIHAGNTLDIRDTTITRGQVNVNHAEVSLTLRRIHYIDNTGPIRTEASATVTIEDSLFENNTVRALYAAGGAQWTVSGSSFVGNSADGNAGGAVLLEDDTSLVIRNSTFSGNTFPPSAAANGARGAAIGFRNATGAPLTLRHVTIVPPAFMPAGIVGTAIGGHGHGVTLDIANSIVRGSCGMNSSVLGNNIGNIESPGNTCGLDTQGNSVNVSTASLALGALGENGGPTPTYLPAAGSLAIDRASTPQCLPVDQRHYTRPGGVRCDVGAVEADGIPNTPDVFADGFE